MSQLATQWYIFLSQLSQGMIVSLDSLIREVNLPIVSAFLFGVIGATSPCQLTTNLSALAAKPKAVGPSRRPWLTSSARRSSTRSWALS